MLGSAPDLLRLLAVPIFGWAAWRDIRTRRVPNRTWYPLAALGVVVLLWDLLGHLPPAGVSDRLFLVRVAFSLGFVIPLSYLFWRIGGFGGADAKALMVLALLFPAFPTYFLPGRALPVVETGLGVFSMTVLTNTVLVGAAYPVALAARNALAGEVSSVMPVARSVSVASIPTAHGRLFETPEGFTRSGLDLDALRMYLRWRGTTLGAVRADPVAHRDPASVVETRAPGDGAVEDGPPVGGDIAPGVTGGRTRPASDGGTPTDATVGSDATDATDYADPWGAEAFLDSIEGTAYGTTPETLRDGLDLLAARESVWISPGIPFIVPMFVGLVVGLTYGDLLFGLLGLFGVV